MMMFVKDLCQVASYLHFINKYKSKRHQIYFTNRYLHAVSYTNSTTKNLKVSLLPADNGPCRLGQGFWVKNRKKAYVFCTLAQNRCSINALSSKSDWGVSKLWPPPPYSPKKEVASQFWTIHLVSLIYSMWIDRKTYKGNQVNCSKL